MTQCKNCIYMSAVGKCMVLSIGIDENGEYVYKKTSPTDTCMRHEPKGVDWSKVPEVIQPNELSDMTADKMLDEDNRWK